MIHHCTHRSLIDQDPQYVGLIQKTKRGCGTQNLYKSAMHPRLDHHPHNFNPFHHPTFVMALRVVLLYATSHPNSLIRPVNVHKICRDLLHQHHRPGNTLNTPVPTSNFPLYRRILHLPETHSHLPLTSLRWLLPLRNNKGFIFQKSRMIHSILPHQSL